MIRTNVFLIVSLLFFQVNAQKHSPENPILDHNLDHNKEIIFGMSGSFSGHFSFYGDSIRNAILACFNSINKTGGIHGKKLRLISLDDHGSAEKTKINVLSMYEKQHIRMFIGVMGTRGILSLLPLIKDKKIALFFPWGNDKKLCDSSLSHIINGFGLMEPQLETIVDHIEQNHSLSQIAIFHADDDLSTHAAKNLTHMLSTRNVQPCAVEHYNRFTMDIFSPANRLINADPRIVICIGTNMPIVKCINRFFECGHFGTRFFGIDSTFLVPDILQQKGAFFHYTSTVPNPITSTIPLAQEYRQNLADYFPQENPSALSFAYYVATTIIVRALQQIHDNQLSPEAIIKNIELMKNYTIKGFSITFDETNRYALGKNVWLI